MASGPSLCAIWRKAARFGPKDADITIGGVAVRILSAGPDASSPEDDRLVLSTRSGIAWIRRNGSVVHGGRACGKLRSHQLGVGERHTKRWSRALIRWEFQVLQHFRFAAVGHGNKATDRLRSLDHIIVNRQTDSPVLNRLALCRGANRLNGR